MKKLLLFFLPLAFPLPAQNPQAPIFPGRASTDSDLWVQSNRFTTTLSNGITAGATSLVLQSATGLVAPVIILIDNEIIGCTTLASTTLSNCTRGMEGTMATMHSGGANIFANVDAIHHNQSEAEIKSLESWLVVGGGGAPSGATASIQTNNGSAGFTGTNVLLSGSTMTGLASGTNVSIQSGLNGNFNSTLGNLTLAGAAETGVGGASSIAGSINVMGGNNFSNNTSSIAGSVEISPGFALGVPAGQQGFVSLMQGYFAGATVTQWHIQCATAVASTAADCPASAAPGNVVGVNIRNSVTSPTFNVVVYSGIVPVSMVAAATVGHTVCITSSNPSQGTDSGGISDCPSGQVKLGTVYATAGTGNFPDGGEAFTLTTTLPLVQLGTPSQTGGAGGGGNVTTPGLTTGVFTKASGTASIINTNLSENSDGSDSAAKALDDAAPNAITAVIAGNTTCDLSLSNACTITFAAAGSTTLVVTNPHGSGPYTFTFIESSLGGNTVLFPASFPNPPGVSVTPSGITIVTCTYDGTANYTCGQPRSNDTPTRLYGPTRTPCATPLSPNLCLWFDSTDNAVEAKDSNNNLSKMVRPGPSLQWSSSNVLDVVGGTITAPTDPTFLWLKDDFPGARTETSGGIGELGWGTNCPTSSTLASFSVLNHPGIWNIAAGGNLNDVCIFRLGSAVDQLIQGLNAVATNQVWEYETVFFISSVNIATQTIKGGMGSADGDTGLSCVADCILWYIDTSVSPNFQLLTCATGVCNTTAAATGAITVAVNTWYQIRLFMTLSGSVSMEVRQGANTQTQNTTLTVPSGGMQPYFYFKNNGTMPSIRLDYFHFSETLIPRF